MDIRISKLSILLIILHIINCLNYIKGVHGKLSKLNINMKRQLDHSYVEEKPSFYRYLIPGGRIFIADNMTKSGFILSPNYPRPYPTNKTSIATLYNHEGNQIESLLMSLYDLEISVSNLCKDESINMFCDNIKPLASIAICGPRLSKPILYKNCSKLRIVFKSSNQLEPETSYIRRGFKLKFEFLDTVMPNDDYRLCDSNQFFRCKNRKCIRKELTCNKVDDCGDASDEDAYTPCKQLPTIDYHINYTCGINRLREPFYDYLKDDVITSAQHSWPYQVSVQLRFIESLAHYCGATLIHPLYALSASHCFSKRSTSDFRLIFGTHDLAKDSSPDLNNHVQVRYVQSVHYFPSPHDIALIEFNAPVKLTPYVWPACLPMEQEYSHANQLCITTGFGATNMPDVSKFKMKQVTELIRHGSQCYPSSSIIYQLDDYSMICAEPTKTECIPLTSGDSGGPLMCPQRLKVHRINSDYNVNAPTNHRDVAKRTKIDNIKTRYTIYGVLSIIVSGNLSGLCHKPAMYNRVSIYMEWILSTMFQSIRFSSNFHEQEQLLGERHFQFGYMFRYGFSRHPNFTPPMTKWRISDFNQQSPRPISLNNLE